MDHINNSSYQLGKKDPPTKIKAKTLKQVKALKDNKRSNKNLFYYLKPTNWPEPRFYRQQKKKNKQGVSKYHIVSHRGTQLCNFSIHIANIPKI